MSKADSLSPTLALDRRGLLAAAGAMAATAAVALPSAAHATGVPLSDDLLDIRRAGERLEISWTLNANVVDEELSAANNVAVDQAHSDFMTLARRIWEKPVLGHIDLVERAEIARYLSLAPNAELEEFLQHGCEDGAAGYCQAVAHLIVAVLALNGGANA